MIDYDEEEVEIFLEHYGVLGMHWGVRHDRPTKGFRLQTAGPTIDASINSSTKKDAKAVASLIKERYGFNISAVKDLKVNNPSEYSGQTVAYVAHTPGRKEGVIFIRPENIDKALKDSEKLKWFAKDTGNVHGLLTHETAHAMFHAEQQRKSGFLKPKTVGGDIKARDAALKASDAQAKKDGLNLNDLSKISGYAAASRTREEVEAELFSQYHWSPNPPPFVKVWGETLHRELGVDPTPFRKVGKR